MPIPKGVNIHFFKTWSSEMAYVLGFFAADGNLVETKRGTCYIALHSSDEHLLCQIQKTMQSEHKIAKRNVRSGNVFRLQIGSQVISADLKKLGFTSRKTSRMSLPHIPKKFIGDFVRGYFDGDGNVWTGYINMRRKTPTEVLQASFTSGSQAFIEDLHILLHECGIVGGAIYAPKKHAFARLTLSTQDALKLAEVMYNVPSKLLLERKRRVFEEFAKGRI